MSVPAMEEGSLTPSQHIYTEIPNAIPYSGKFSFVCFAKMQKLNLTYALCIIVISVAAPMYKIEIFTLGILSTFLHKLWIFENVLYCKRCLEYCLHNVHNNTHSKNPQKYTGTYLTAYHKDSYFTTYGV